MSDLSKIIRSGNLDWPDLARKIYKPTTTGFKDISRYVLLGDRDDEQELNIQTRYFKIADGGYSSLERHRHPHTVVVVKGKGSIILNNRISHLEYMDAVYIAPDTVHQFHADRNVTLGFICIVDRDRDRPETPKDEQELKDWITDPQVRKKARI